MLKGLKIEMCCGDNLKVFYFSRKGCEWDASIEKGNTTWN